MDRKKTILEKIKETREEASSWEANDGGLTFAAQDLLAVCGALEKALKKFSPDKFLDWFLGWCGSEDPPWDLDGDTGPETELLHTVWVTITQ